jgi:hypothetical protein
MSGPKALIYSDGDYVYPQSIQSESDTQMTRASQVITELPEAINQVGR